MMTLPELEEVAGDIELLRASDPKNEMLIDISLAYRQLLEYYRRDWEPISADEGVSR